MAFKSALTQTQTMKRRLSVQLQQSIHMLQLSTAELAEYVQEQATANPMLELTWRRPRIGKGEYSADRDRGGLNGKERHPETLEAALIGQLRTSGNEEAFAGQNKIAAYLAGNLNEDGYLEIGLEEAAESCRMSLTQAEAALRLLQSLEPAGIGARALGECLMLQINRDPDADPLAGAIVESHLHDLAGGRLKRIASALRVPLAEVVAALDYIRSLDPRPGLAYCEPNERYSVPDAVIAFDARGELAVTLIDSFVPRLTLNGLYQSMLADGSSSEAKLFLRDHVQAAKWLIRSLEQRNATLCRAISAIAAEQQAFLTGGPGHLRPLTMKAVADKLGLHESTISRAVRNKYVQTPHGLYELSGFFAGGLPAAQSQEGASAERIKARIRHLIGEEDKRMPLSDQKIADLLAEDGMPVARRTVVKYREELRLLSSRFRSVGAPDLLEPDA